MNIIDLHCDTIFKIHENSLINYEDKKDIKGDNTTVDIKNNVYIGDLRSNNGHLDLLRMKENEYLLQNFALFVNKGMCEDVYEEYLKLLNIYNKEIDKNHDIIGKVFSYSDIDNNINNGKMSAMLTIEEGAVCKGSIDILHKVYEDGVRLMTLTWNYQNELGYPNIDADRSKEFGAGSGNNLRTKDVELFYRIPDINNGLTKTGIEFVEEMENIGMIIDTSHMSDAGFYDVLNNTHKPFIASHSNARSISAWVRNMSDDMIKRLADRGGIIGLNYCPDFLTEMPFGVANPGTMEAVVRHAKYIANIGGIECLGFGSDFDGIDTNEGIKGVECMQDMAQSLHDGGFSYNDVEKICYKNVLRFYKNVLN